LPAQDHQGLNGFSGPPGICQIDTLN